MTLWGPTHLMLLGGAAMTLIGQAMLLTEALRALRGAGLHAAGEQAADSPTPWWLARRAGSASAAAC